MNRAHRPLRALAVIATVVLIGACGSSAPTGTGVAAGTSTPSSAGSGASKREQAVRFAECMRVNGVPHFPDPGPNGDFNFGVDVSPAVFAKAVDACKALQPPGSLSGKRSPRQQSLALKFAQCVRSDGVPDFPDPVNGQPLIDTTKIPSSNAPRGMTVLNSATHKCRGLLQLAAEGGTGG